MGWNHWPFLICARRGCCTIKKLKRLQAKTILSVLDVHYNNKELAHPTSESTIYPLFIFSVPFSSLLNCAVSPPEMREKVSVSLLHRQPFTPILLYCNPSLLALYDAAAVNRRKHVPQPSICARKPVDLLCVPLLPSSCVFVFTNSLFMQHLQTFTNNATVKSEKNKPLLRQSESRNISKNAFNRLGHR